MSKGNRIKMDDSKVAMLETMLKQGVPVAKIAKHYGCSGHAVYDIIRRSGLSQYITKHGNHQAYYDEWRKLAASGMNARQISQQYKVPYSAVYGVISGRIGKEQQPEPVQQSMPSATSYPTQVAYNIWSYVPQD